MKKNVHIATSYFCRMLETATVRNFVAALQNAVKLAKKTVKNAGLKNQRTRITFGSLRTSIGSGSGEKVIRVTGVGNRQKRALRYKIS